MSLVSANALAEKLVQTVARAFYPDNVVAILDALVREKYIREEELGPRLKLPNKEIRKVLCQLQEEMIVKCEDVTMEDRRTSQCWYVLSCLTLFDLYYSNRYVDYQLFTHVVRYRIHKMKTEVHSKERDELTRMYFLCPTCHARYSELDAQTLRSKDFKFICPHCCPQDDFKNTMSQKYFTLELHDTGGQLTEVQKLERKMDDQFSASDYHEGIYDLLQDLRNENIIRNLPSENIKRGLMTSKVTDEDVQLRIEENASTTGRKRKADDGPTDEYSVHIVDDTEARTLQAEAQAIIAFDETQRALKKQQSLPAFLQGSRIVPLSASALETPLDTPVASAQEGDKKEQPSDESDEEWED
jgi:transcription initiation factor IIE alpha subunit